MANRDLLGHIDCPTCGQSAGMRITEDKNGEPFGYCEANCSQQMRIGGDKRRVSGFYDNNPNIKRPGNVEKTPVTITAENAPASKGAAMPADPVPVQKTPVIVKRSSMADALAFMTGNP